jgi:hypothetical protein
MPKPADTPSSTAAPVATADPTPGAEAPHSYDEEAAKMVQQAVADYIQTLPPAARLATELYFRGVLPRVKVLTP